ncbi:MAG: hypothetical protein ACXWIN_08300, partial [Burkholderiaceae bacterium]
SVSGRILSPRPAAKIMAFIELISYIGGYAFAPESGLARRATRRIAMHIRKERNAVQRRFWCEPSGKMVWTAHCRVAALAQGPP